MAEERGSARGAGTCVENRQAKDNAVTGEGLPSKDCAGPYRGLYRSADVIRRVKVGELRFCAVRIQTRVGQHPNPVRAIVHDVFFSHSRSPQATLSCSPIHAVRKSFLGVPGEGFSANSFWVRTSWDTRAGPYTPSVVIRDGPSFRDIHAQGPLHPLVNGFRRVRLGHAIPAVVFVPLLPRKMLSHHSMPLAMRPSSIPAPRPRSAPTLPESGDRALILPPTDVPTCNTVTRFR